jgi:hypothetical protein
MGASDALAQARAALAHANAFTGQVNAVAPPASLTPGSGHGVGVSFAQAHGNDHTGTIPASARPVGYVQDAAEGLANKQANVDAYLKGQ